MYSRYLNFYLDILVMQKKGLIRKIRLILKFKTSQTGKHTIVIHILPNISRSKSNQPMKFSQLIEYNNEIFLVKSYTKCGEEAIPRPFSKKFKIGDIWINSLHFCSVYLIVSQSEGIPNHIETKMLTICFYLI